MNPNNKKYKKIKTFTGARFIMILIIVCSHFEFFKRTEFAEVYWRYFHNATMGVDYFFLLSGFGMMLSYMKGTNVSKVKGIQGAILFGRNKVRKIYPVYVISLLICLPYLLLIIYRNNSLIKILGVLGSKFCLCLTLLQSGTGLMAFSNGINSVGWFLSSLFIIYIFSPLILKVISRVDKNSVWAVLIGFISIYLLNLKLLSNIEKNSLFDNLVYGSPYSRIWIVCIGMVIALIYIYYIEERVISSKTASLVESMTVIFMGGWFFTRNGIDQHYIRILDIVLLILFLIVFSFEQGKISRFLSSKTLVKLGDITMFVFLLHYPIRLYVDWIFKKTEFGKETGGCFVEALIIVMSSLVVSLIMSKRFNQRPKESWR